MTGFTGNIFPRALYKLIRAVDTEEALTLIYDFLPQQFYYVSRGSHSPSLTLSILSRRKLDTVISNEKL